MNKGMAKAMNDKKTTQSEKARNGAIGEQNVVSKLMQHGWDAFNANCTIKNYKSIDVVCLNSELPESEDCLWKPKMVLVQVKTSVQKNIPVGFTIRQSLDKAYLERNVKGPYVFVYVDNKAKADEREWKFRYFVISRSQFIELLFSAHQWYVNDYQREKGISLEGPAGLSIDWLSCDTECNSVKETKNHKAFNNPLKESCEDCWDNIWKD